MDITKNLEIEFPMEQATPLLEIESKVPKTKLEEKEKTYFSCVP